MFALGVTLFCLRAGRPPFKLANPFQDYFYRLLAGKKFQIFWDTYEQVYEFMLNSNQGNHAQDLTQMLVHLFHSSLFHHRTNPILRHGRQIVMLIIVIIVIIVGIGNGMSSGENILMARRRR